MEILITAAVTFIVGALSSPVVLHLIRRGRNRAETTAIQLGNDEAALKLHVTESDVLKKLRDDLEEAVSKGLEEHRRSQDIQMEKSSLELMIKIKDGELSEQRDMIRGILIDQGKAMEREKRCQTELAQRKSEILELSEKVATMAEMSMLVFDLKEKLKNATAENMQMSSILEHQRSPRSDDEENDVEV